jgi:hypothetical protein
LTAVRPLPGELEELAADLGARAVRVLADDHFACPAVLVTWADLHISSLYRERGMGIERRAYGSGGAAFLRFVIS